MVPPSSNRISRVPPYLIRASMLLVRGYHPLWLAFPGHSNHISASADPRSLAATGGVSIDVLSSGYLDVSVPRVRLLNPIYSGKKYLFSGYSIQQIVSSIATAYYLLLTVTCQMGCPIRKSVYHGLFPASHSLSQSTTSFIASYCLGIHQTPFSRLI